MLLGDLVENFAHDLVQTIVAFEIGVVAVPRVHLCVQGRGDFKHAVTHFFQTRFGIFQNFVRGAIGGKRQFELSGVVLGSRTVTRAARPPRQILLRKRLNVPRASRAGAAATS